MLYSPSVLRIQKVQRQNASDFYLGKEEWQASINVPPANFAKNGLYWLPSQLSNVLTKCSFGFFSNFHRCLFVNLHSLRDSYCFEINIILFFFPFHGVENHIREISLLMHTVYLIRSLLKFELSRFFSLLYVSPLPCLGSVVVGIVYKDLHDLLTPDQPIRIKAGNRR